LLTRYGPRVKPIFIQEPSPTTFES